MFSILHGRPLRIQPSLSYLAIAAILVLRADMPARANGAGVDPVLDDFQKKRGEVHSYTARFVQKKILTLFDETKISTGIDIT